MGKNNLPQVPAAKNVLSVLRYIAAQAGPVGAGSIVRDVGLPRSTTYHLLAALIDDGFVVHLPEERKYALGVTAHELGTGYSRQAPLQRIARFPMQRLVERTKRTAHLAIMHGRDVIYVIEERAKRQADLVTNPGVRLPAHLTASGRAMLATFSPDQLTALYPGPEAFPTRYETGVHSVAQRWVTLWPQNPSGGLLLGAGRSDPRVLVHRRSRQGPRGARSCQRDSDHRQQGESRQSGFGPQRIARARGRENGALGRPGVPVASRGDQNSNRNFPPPTSGRLRPEHGPLRSMNQGIPANSAPMSRIPD